MAHKWIALVDFALAARLTWHAAYAKALAGEVRAERREGRWFVVEADALRVVRERAEAQMEAAHA